MFADNKCDYSPLLHNVAEMNVIKTGVCEVFGLKNTSPKLARHTTTNGEQVNVSTKVIVTIYKTSSEYFAVLYPLKMLISARTPLNCINLKACKIENISGGKLFKVVHRKDEDGNFSPLTFKVNDSDTEDDSWINAFSQCNTSSGSSGNGCDQSSSPDSHLIEAGLRKGSLSLPTLVESDEEIE